MKNGFEFTLKSNILKLDVYEDMLTIVCGPPHPTNLEVRMPR